MNSERTDMSGKTCLITGATSGIGLATAAALARMGAAIVGVSRNRQKCEQVQERLRRETGNPAVDYLQADLSARAECIRLAELFVSRYSRLDVLVNNVGAFFMSRQLSADGIEMTWALNYLGVYLLTHRLLDALRASAPARIVNVASDVHRTARLNFADLQGEHRYNGVRAYGQSKLALVMFTYDLAQRLAGSGVTANALHPGFVASNIYDSVSVGGSLVRWVIRRMALSPEAGAETSIYLASAPEAAGFTGQYFVKKRPVASSSASYDKAAAERLMALSDQMAAG